MRFAHLAAALLFALGATPALQAQTVTLAGREVRLVVPQGYCAVDERGTAEGRVVERIRHGVGPNSRLLLVFAECGELKALRDAKPGDGLEGFSHYGTFGALAQNGEVMVLDQYDRAQFIQLAVKGASNGQVVADALKRAEARIRERRPLNQRAESLGVLDVDAHAAYVGVRAAQDGPKGAGTDILLAIGGVTLIKGLNVAMTVYQPLTGPEDLGTLLARQKTNLAAVIAANP